MSGRMLVAWRAHCRWRNRISWGSGLLIAAMLGGCTLLEQAAETPTAVPPLMRVDVQLRLTEASEDVEIALDVWDRVILGEPVSCVEAIPVPQPLVLSESDRAAHVQAARIAAEFNAAVQGLRNSADLWEIECADERAFVPLAMAREGRAAAVSANQALNSAQALFELWPEDNSP